MESKVKGKSMVLVDPEAQEFPGSILSEATPASAAVFKTIRIEFPII